MNGLRPLRIGPFNRGCTTKVVFENRKDDGEWVDMTGKKIWLTAKAEPYDFRTNDNSAIFKVEGTISETETGRAVFQLTEKETWQDPEEPYFFDIVMTDSDGTNAERLAIGNFRIIGGANNAQAGGDEYHD